MASRAIAFFRYRPPDPGGFRTKRLAALLGIAWLSVLSGCSVTPPAPETQPANWQAVRDALSLQGQPYRNGSGAPGQGFDCSGLVQYVYAQQGVRLPRDTLSMARQLPSIAIEQRQPGDLLFFDVEGKPYSHVGVYLGEDAFVHAPRTGKQVVRSSLVLPYWRERLTGVRRPAATP